MKRDIKEWIYITNGDNTARYALGVKGEHPIVCVGVNPSTASPERLDPTIQSVQRIAAANGYDGWIMLNLTPQRSTNPDALFQKRDEVLYEKNLEVIRNILYKHNPSIWVAWGTLHLSRDYLIDTMEEIYLISKTQDCSIDRYSPLTKEGHPRHPLYQGTNKTFHPFDLMKYLAKYKTYEDVSERIVPIYKSDNIILIALAEDIPLQGMIGDCLVMKVDIEHGRLEGEPWSGQKMLKFGIYDSLNENEKAGIKTRLKLLFDPIELNRLYTLLKNPPPKSIESMDYERERFANEN